MADFINIDAAYDSDTLTDWYISSVGSEPPVWTDEHIEELLNDFYVIPKDTQTADVEPVRHGHWVKEKKDVLIHWHCSACKECYFLEEPNAKYCPNCGAKMDGDKNDT